MRRKSSPLSTPRQGPAAGLKQSKAREPKRGKGRPSGTKNGIGRQRLVDVTRELLRTTPPAELTSLQVARAAGGDRTLIRYYFGDLPNLLAEVARQLSIGLIEQLENASKRPGSATDRLKHRIREFVRYELANPALHPLYTEKISNPKSGPPRGIVNQIAARGHESLREIILEGQRNGEFRRDFDIRLLDIAIIGLAEFIVVGQPILEAWLAAGEEFGDLMDSYGEFVADMVLRGIRSDGPSRLRGLSKTPQ